MTEHSLSDFMLILIAVTVFSILFVVIKNSLQNTTLFKGRTFVVLAVCVSLLCIIGLYRFFIVTDGTTEAVRNEDEMLDPDFILLPYVALAISIFILWLISKLYVQNPIIKSKKKDIRKLKNIKTKKKY